MGSLQYDSQVFPVDDRMLLHVQTVIAVKLRRKEPFLLSWVSDVSAGSGCHAGVAVACQAGSAALYARFPFPARGFRP